MSYHTSVFSLLLLIGVSYAQYAPLFAWSESIQFSQQPTGTVDGRITQYSEIKSYLSSLLKSEYSFGSSNNNALKMTSTPEIVIVYLKSEISSNDISDSSQHFQTLQKIVNDAKYSLTIPFLSQLKSPSFESILSELYSQNITVYHLGERFMSRKMDSDNVKLIYSIDDENLPMYNNGKTDLLIVPVDNMLEREIGKRIENEMTMIQDINNIVNKASKGNYVSIFTGANTQKSTIYNKKDARIQEDKNTGGKKQKPKWSEYLLKGWLWELIIFGVIFLTIVISVNVAFLNMQTPELFTKHQVDIKE